MKERTAARISLGLFWSTLALGCASVLAIGLGAAVTFGGGDRSSFAGALTFGTAIAVVAVGISLLGMLMVRRARNLIGWGFQVMAAAAVTSLAADAALQLTLGRPDPIHPPGISVAGWVSSISLIVLVMPIPAIFLLFPTGRPLSARWTWAIRLWAAGVAVTLVWAAFRPGEVYGNPPPDRVHVDNPFGLEAVRWIFPLLAWIGGMMVLAAAALGVASLVVRFRRSRGEERAQMRWLAFVAVIAALLILASFSIVLAFGDPSPVSNAFGGYLYSALVLTLLVGMPVSVAIAILKYRLYDIDVVINKAVVYGLLAAFITAVYVAIVVGIGAAIGGGRAKPSLGLSIVATAVVAVAFQPVRERVQKLANRLVYGARATPYEVLSEFSSRMAGTYATEDLLPRMARVLAEGTGARRAVVWLKVGDDLEPQAAWPMDDLPPRGHPMSGAELPDLSATLALPVRHRGELLGALSLSKPSGERLTPVEERLANDVASGAGLVLRNVRLTEESLQRLEELRVSRQRLVSAQDEERRRLERTMHDGAQQQLVALAARVGLARSLTGRDPERASEMLTQAEAEVTRALEDLRDLARGIYPPVLADRGLVVALDAQARKSPILVEIEGYGIGRYRQEFEAAIYFTTLEALQNVAKHARASKAIVRLSVHDDSLCVVVEDDGAGFDPSVTSYGSGLQGMADRLAALGGTLEVRSQPGQGTTVTGRLPVRQLERVVE